ncbi:MAG: NADH-quinone oxidoreductase subunit M [Candidatus Gastranaerophilaceae bacterium]|jgi:NAD(P)H-quinone oxidoreductase chain 4|uniref:NADH-quinone oxidoreductase subunit M n=1 Tax=Candidatus Limenecus avicola TaxID=2840847 RepID=A0A9D1SQV7_9CLOT|nr:NADH-quinone oxidoreductase subunit M [Clostridium sp.]CDC18863.1 proton-translocating NADH-quinone oxidoreductase chain M [Clostridium sp. CAG:306]HIU92438.1 NADH-quinone oxidoreductase subunit M [Candidatus Limenecus avicola]
MSFLSLIWLIFAPILAALVIMFPRFPNHQVLVRRFAKWFASIHFVYALLFLAFFDTGMFGMSYEKELTFFGMSWLKSLGISAKFAVDGIALLMVVLTTFIVLITLFMSKIHIRSKHKLYYSMVFLLESSILGIFCAKDMFLFFVFWELSLIPVYFIVSQWGDSEARRAAIKFTLSSFVANMFLLFGMLILYYYNFAVSNVLTANIESLNMDEKIYPMWFQIMVFVNFLIGFVIRVPFVPFHNWYPDIQSKAAAPVNILLAGMLLNTGVYGLIRFNMQVFPAIFKLFAPVLMVWGIVNIIYSGALSIVQSGIKKMVAYANVSSMGFVMVGLACLNPTGFNGAVFMSIACAVVYSAFFVIISCVQFRTKTTYITALGGLGKVMPKCMYLALIICFSAIGVPFLMMFTPKLMVLSGAMLSNLEQQLTVKIAAIIGLAAIVVSAGYIMYFFYKVFCSVLLEQWKKIKDLSPQETGVLSALCLIIIYFGVYPMSIIQIYQSVSSIIIDVLQV